MVLTARCAGSGRLARASRYAKVDEWLAHGAGWGDEEVWAGRLEPGDWEEERGEEGEGEEARGKVEF